MQSESINFFQLSFNLVQSKLQIDLNICFIFFLLILGIILFLIFREKVRKFKLVKLNIPLGKINLELTPNIEDLQIAHKIWTQLVTRKAAIKIDQENDVISEIYDSWYQLFTEVRCLVSSIPADLIKNEKSTKNLVKIATDTLNLGLRPHLTKWNVRYRSWYEFAKDQNLHIAPQELQKQFPDYRNLMVEMLEVNDQLIIYAQELKKLIDQD